MQFQSRSSEIHVLLTNFLHLIDLVPSDFHDEDECFVFADKKNSWLVLNTGALWAQGAETRTAKIVIL